MATNAGQFSKSVVTTAGKEMIVQAQNGHTLTFTRVALGDGTLAEGEDMLALTAIKSEKLSANISSFLDKGNGQFQLKFNVNNSTLDTGFWHREIGVMAKIDDGEEALYAYSYAGTAASFLYDKTTPVQERLVNIDVLIGSASDITVEIDGSVVYLTRAEVAALISEHNESADSHPLTIDDTVAPTSDTAPMPTILNNVANMLKAISGESGWKGVPGKSLAALVSSLSTGITVAADGTFSNPTLGISGLMATNGYICFGPNFGGLILQWGAEVTDSSGRKYVTFPVAFTRHVRVTVTGVTVNSQFHNMNAVSNTQFTCVSRETNSGALSPGLSFNWIAVGR